ncbi:TonB-dependent receptor domain-containing protein [Rheinheimera pacifica]|uniref:TonB-dependent receptor domain-containing protein n=1 Tax=Rheinheimera pacifica TaxID=173990 RepID=UPI002EDB576D
MYINNKISKAVRIALAFGAASTTAFTFSASAAEEDATAKVERIEVTGSRIKRTDMEGASPVSVFSFSDIQNTGAVTIAEFLRTNAAVSGFNESQGLSQAGGASSVGTKNLSPEYTLILLNGRRVPKNSAGGIFTDVNQLPMAAVDRIEILGDGASAIYGSDAVAGVINVITKKNYEGVQVSFQTGMGVEHHDGKENKLSIVAGVQSGKTNILFAAEHFTRDATPFTNRNMGKTALLQDSEGNIIPGGEGRSPSGTPGYTALNFVGATNNSGLPTSALGNKAWADCPEDQINSSNQCLYDVGPLYFSQPKGDRQSLFTQITHDWSDALQLDAQFRYNRVYTLNSNGAAPGGVVVAGGAGRIAPSEFVKDYLLNDRFGGDEALYQQTLNALAAGTASLQVVRRYLDFGNREKDVTNQTYEAIGGFDWQINDDFSLTGDIGFSRLTNQQVGVGGNVLSTPAANAFISGALNPFVINDCNSEELKALCNSLNAAIHRTSNYEIGFGSLVFGGMLPVELPGGQVGMALGVDVRNETYRDVSDPATVQGQVLGGAGSNGGGAYSNEAAFIELALPVFDQLEITLAARHDKADWDLADDSQTTYSGKFAYRPTDTLLLRGSLGTGFKAPNLSNLFLATSQGVTRAIDTKLCNAAVAAGGDPATHADCLTKELNSRGGGNPELTSEKSKSASLGVVFEPIENLSFSLDYWKLDIDNIVGSLAIQEILNEEAEGRLTELVIRAPNGTVNDALREGYVRTNLQNLNERKLEGLLLDVSDRSDLGFGVLRSTLKAEYRLKDMNQTSRTQPLCDSSKNGARNWNANATFTLDVQDFSTSLSIRYLPGYDVWQSRNTAQNSCELIGYFDVVRQGTTIVDFGKPLSVSSYTEMNLATTYNVTQDTSVTLGMRNLFDRDPPFSTPNAWPFYNQEMYSNMGRFVYVGFDTKF